MIPYVVGLDFSITASGIADSTGRVVTAGRSGVTTLPLAQRCLALRQVGATVWERLALRDGESVLVIESLQATSGKGNGGLIERGFVWYWLVSTALERGIRVATVHPSSVKRYATGHGDANKREVVAAVTSWDRWQIGRDNNKADAAVLCAIGMHLLGDPVVEVTPTMANVVMGIELEGEVS